MKRGTIKPRVSLKRSVWPVCTVITIYWLGSCYCGPLDVHRRLAFYYLLWLFYHVSDVYLREFSPEALRTDLFWWSVWLICGTAVTDTQRRIITFVLNYAQRITWLLLMCRSAPCMAAKNAPNLINLAWMFCPSRVTNPAPAGPRAQDLLAVSSSANYCAPHAVVRCHIIDHSLGQTWTG